MIRVVNVGWCFVLMALIWPMVLLKSGLTVVAAQNQTVVEIGSVDPGQLNTTKVGHLIGSNNGYWYGSYFWYDIHSNVCIVQTQLVTTKAGIIYAFELTPGSPSMATEAIPTQIQIIQVRPGNSSKELSLVQSTSITLNTTISSHATIYYFNSTQLFEVEPNDLFGYCFGARPFLFVDRWGRGTTNYVWTPTSLTSGPVNASSITVETNASPFSIQFYQWNVNLTDLNMTKFEAFYEPRAPPNVGFLDGIDPFNLPPVLLGDTMPSDGLLEKSTLHNRCIVPNVPVTGPTLVYAFSGSALAWNGLTYTIKLIHVRMINPPTIILTNSTTATVKLIQSVDINIGQGSTSSRFEYDLPNGQFFSLQTGDFVGYCLDDRNYYPSTTPTYFQYQQRPPSDGHSVFTFHLGPGSDVVTLRSEVHDFNAHGWKNMTLTQLNGLALQIFIGRGVQNNGFGRAGLVSDSGPYTDATAPLLTPIPGLDPSSIVNTTLGSLVPGADTRDTVSDLCTTWQPPIGPGVVYGIKSSMVPSTSTIAPIRLLLGTEQLDTVNNILNMGFYTNTNFDIIIPPSSTATKFEFYFTYDQLFWLSGGSDLMIGFCTPAGQPGIFPWVSDSSNLIRQLAFSHMWSAQQIYQDHRSYDFELLQWPNIYAYDLDETETRAWLTKKAIESNQLRPNTYPLPSHSIDPTAQPPYSFLYGYQYSSDSAYSIGGQTHPQHYSLIWVSDSNPHCALFGYSKADMGDLTPGIIYSIEATSLQPSEATTLTIIIARDVSANQDQTSFQVKSAVHVPIEASDYNTKLKYFFPSDQLLELRVGEYIGACSSGLLSQTDSIDKTILYRWSTSNSTLSTVGATATPISKNTRALDLQVNGWSYLTLDQLNLTAANEYLSSARNQLGGKARVQYSSTPSDGPSGSGSGGLSASGQIVLWVCLAIFLKVGLIMFFINRRRRRRLALLALVSPAPRLSPAPNAPVSASHAQPKPSGGFVTPESPSVPMGVPMQQSPPPYPHQPQPVVYYSPSSPTQHQPIASPSSAGVPDIEMQSIAPSPISNEGTGSNSPLPPPYTFNAPMNAQESSVGDGTIRFHLAQSSLDQVQPPSSSSSMIPMSSGPSSPSGVIQVRFCPSCGQSRTPPTATFCSACGYKY